MLTPQQTRKPGQSFVSGLIAFTIFWVILYVVSHSLPDKYLEFTKINLEQSYRLSPQGEFVLTDQRPIFLALGKINSEFILKRLTQRSIDLHILVNSIKVDAEKIRVNLIRKKYNSTAQDSPNIIIHKALAISDCEGCNIWHQTYRKLEIGANEYRKFDNFEEINGLINNLLEKINKLEQINNQQISDIQSLKPNSGMTFFWSSPSGSAFEVFFFAIFGVLTNLLVTSVEYLRNSNFQTNERWVAYTKLVYGPILAWILLNAIAVGWLDLGQYEVSTYSLPLLAFILGFFARKTVNLFNKMGKKILGATEKSIQDGPAQITAGRRAALEQYLHSLKPRNINEIKQSAFDIQKDIVKTIVLEKEASK